jgi:hypothetical protein
MPILHSLLRILLATLLVVLVVAAAALYWCGDLHSRTLVRRTLGVFRAHASFPSEGVAAPALVQGVDWSDHWSYAQFGAPAIMLTDTAPFRYPYYHTAQDTPDKVDYQRLARVVQGVEAVARDLAGKS